MGIDITKQYIASMKTSLGKIEVSLNASAAPRIVNNFIFLALHHFYDGLIFHRVVKNHSVHSGDPTGVGVGGPGYTFDDGRATGEPYEVGSVAMAHTGRNTLGSRFFIVSGPDGCGVPSVYTKFGRVTRGLRTLEKIQSVPTPRFLDVRTLRPVTDIVIESVTISIRG
jgi:peptidylprolyl isomerase